MSFDILSGADRPMYPGQIIQYIVTPILGIKPNGLLKLLRLKINTILLMNNVMVPMRYGITSILLRRLMVVLKWKILLTIKSLWVGLGNLYTPLL